MNREEQLGWEDRWARPAAAAAAAGALLPVAAQFVQASAFSGTAGKKRAYLVALSENMGTAWAGRVVLAVSYFFVAAALLYLLQCTRHRRPNVIPGIAGLAVLFPVLLTVGGVLSQLELNDVAEAFVDTGARSEGRADKLLDDQSTTPGFFVIAGALSLGFTLVVVSLNAMRAGLLSRFMGVLGIVTGAFGVLSPGGAVILQVFWLGALAVLFAGRWPGGRGPAWESGQEEPWPRMADQRAEMLRQQEAAQAEEGRPDEPGEEERPRRQSRKRRKKRS